MVIVCAIPLAMITIGTKAELGQECRYERIIDVDKHGNTKGRQTYHCKTAPREVVTKTEYVKVRTCMSKLLFGFDCEKYTPEGDQVASVLEAALSLGLIR